MNERRQAVAELRAAGLSERRSCALAGISRSCLRYQPRSRDDEVLVADLQAFAQQHRRWGYRQAAATLRRRGQRVNVKRVHRVWKQAGLQVPARRRRRTRVGSHSAAQNPHRAEYPGHVITYDFLQDATTDGRALRILTVTDEFTRENWAIAVARSFPASRVIEVLAKAFAEWGTPGFVRSDNGPEFIAQAVVAWLYRQGIDTHHIDPGSPWQNPFAEAFHSRFRDECLDQESFAGLLEAQVICEGYHHHHNHNRLHSSLGYLTPVEFHEQWRSAHPSEPIAEGVSTALSRPERSQGSPDHATLTRPIPDSIR